ncbi:F-box only protein 31-A [Bienertia sinuspersici]
MSRKIPRTIAKRKGLLTDTVSTRRRVAVDLTQDLKESNGLNLDSDDDYALHLDDIDAKVDSENESLDDEDDDMEELEN